MMRFQHISHLYILTALPVLVLLFFWLIYWRRNKLKKLGDERLINEQVLGFITGRNTFKFILMALAFAAVAVGWANLQQSDKTEKIQSKGVDVVVALDVSKSMLAQDIQPDRLTRAKQLMQSLLDKLKGDRVALVVFAGRAYLQVPITIDFGALKMMLQNVKPDLVPTQGTVISEAIDLSIKSFSQKEKKYKSLIIISDGEDHDENAQAKVKEATEAGIIIHTVGVGSPEGAALYDPTTKAPKLDEQGNPVISKLNEEELKAIASAGGGTYSLLRNADDVASKLAGEIDDMEQKSLGSVTATNYTSYFQYFLALGLVALLIEWLLPGAKPMKKLAIVAKKKVTALILLMCIPFLAAHAQTSMVRKGNKLYEQKKYKDAANAYQQALVKNPTYTPGMFNLGNSLYQQKQYDAARKVLEATGKTVKDKNAKGGVNYNIGNTYMEEQKWQEAVDAYKTALRNNPQDEDAKYNLSYAQQMLKKDQQQNKDKNKDDKKDQDKKDQDKKDQQKQDEKKDEDKKDQDKKDQQKQDDKQDKKEERPEPQQSKLNEKQAEQLLNALQQEEKKLQDKMQKGKAVPVKVEKDW